MLAYACKNEIIYMNNRRYSMANTSVVYARIDSDLKENAEGILSQLGISPSSAIQMFYSQILLNKGVPFDLKLPDAKIGSIGGMNRQQIDMELQKGIDSLDQGSYSPDDTDRLLMEKYGI